MVVTFDGERTHSKQGPVAIVIFVCNKGLKMKHYKTVLANRGAIA